MSVGVYLPVSYPRGLPPSERMLRYASECELLGFDSLWVGDHLLWRAPMLEPLTTLASVAARTTRIDLGINVLLLGLRPPLISARMLGNLWWLSGGRLVLGVGVGGDYPREFEASGVPLGQRGDRLDSSLDELRRWWADDGEESVSPRPAETVRLWVGGRSEPALRRVVRERASAFTAHLVSPRRLKEMKERLVELSYDAGQDAPEVSVTVMINVGPGGHLDDAEKFLAAHFGAGSERVVRYLIRGDESECLRGVAAYREIADHLIFLPASFDSEGQLHRLAELKLKVEDR